MQRSLGTIDEEGEADESTSAAADEERSRSQANARAHAQAKAQWAGAGDEEWFVTEGTPARAAFGSVHLSLQPDDVIQGLATIALTESTLSEKKLPRSGAAQDPKCGPSERSVSCSSCAQTMRECAGHIGVLNFSLPVTAAIADAKPFRLYHCVCYSCGRLLLDPTSAKFKHIQDTYVRGERLDAFYEASRGIGCCRGVDQPYLPPAAFSNSVKPAASAHAAADNNRKRPNPKKPAPKATETEKEKEEEEEEKALVRDCSAVQPRYVKLGVGVGVEFTRPYRGNAVKDEVFPVFNLYTQYQILRDLTEDVVEALIGVRTYENQRQWHLNRAVPTENQLEDCLGEPAAWMFRSQLVPPPIIRASVMRNEGTRKGGDHPLTTRITMMVKNSQLLEEQLANEKIFDVARDLPSQYRLITWRMPDGRLVQCSCSERICRCVLSAVGGAAAVAAAAATAAAAAAADAVVGEEQQQQQPQAQETGKKKTGRKKAGGAASVPRAAKKAMKKKKKRKRAEGEEEGQDNETQAEDAKEPPPAEEEDGDAAVDAVDVHRREASRDAMLARLEADVERLPPGEKAILHLHGELQASHTQGVMGKTIQRVLQPKDTATKYGGAGSAAASAAAGGAASSGSKSIMQGLVGKGGRSRGTQIGKRTNFTGRAVISPDQDLDPGEIGLPRRIWSWLTRDEVVTSFNRARLTSLLRAREIPYIRCGSAPGATRWDTNHLNCDVHRLKIGHVVERYLCDGDVVLFNRQPSLLRTSFMGFRMRRLYKGDAITFNEICCPPFNADFDGDEMNVHVPQSVVVTSEVTMIMPLADQHLSPENGDLLQFDAAGGRSTGRSPQCACVCLTRSSLARVCRSASPTWRSSPAAAWRHRIAPSRPTKPSRSSTRASPPF